MTQPNTFTNMEDIPNDAWGEEPVYENVDDNYVDDNYIDDNYDDNYIDDTFDYDYIDMEDVPDEAWGAIYDDPDKLEIDLLTKNLNVISKRLELHEVNPTEEIKLIKDQYKTICNDSENVINTSFFLKTLSENLGKKIAQCEQLFDDIELAKKLEEEFQKEARRPLKLNGNLEFSENSEEDSDVEMEDVGNPNKRSKHCREESGILLPYKKNKEYQKLKEEKYKMNVNKYKLNHLNDHNSKTIQKYLDQKKYLDQNPQTTPTYTNELVNDELKKMNKQTDEYVKWLNKL